MPIISDLDLSVTEGISSAPKLNAVALWFYAENQREIAKKSLEIKLCDFRFYYVLYGLLDGLSLSYSILKYYFDLSCGDDSSQSADIMHCWLLTSVGIITAALGSFVMIVCAIIANGWIKSGQDKDSLKTQIELIQPYVRDAIKGLKNAYKGLRSTLQVASILSSCKIQHLLVPIGLVMGILSAANRIWYRQMKDKRKNIQELNSKMQLKLLEESTISSEMLKEAQEQIQCGRQSNATKMFAMLSAAYGGVVDGPYLCMGMMSLTIMSTPIFVAILGFSILMMLLTIAIRMHEEHEYQRKLEATRLDLELTVCAKYLEKAYLSLVHNTDNNTCDSTCSSSLDECIKDFEKKHAELNSCLEASNLTIVLAGLRNGLYAFSAISAGLYAIVAINSMLMLAPISPIFLLVVAGISVLCLLAFLIHALIEAYQHREITQAQIVKSSEAITAIKSSCLQTNDMLSAESLKSIIGVGMCVNAAPQFYFQDWFEVFRSFFSGVAKGQKAIDFTFNPLQELDGAGHYHDSTIMLWFVIISSAIHTCGLAARAYIRGFSRNPDYPALKPHTFFKDHESTTAVIAAQHAKVVNVSGSIQVKNYENSISNNSNGSDGVNADPVPPLIDNDDNTNNNDICVVEGSTLSC